MQNSSGQTALIIAALGGIDECIPYLTAEIGKQDCNGWSALHWACFLGHAKCVSQLLEESDLKSLTNETALLIA